MRAERWPWRRDHSGQHRGSGSCSIRRTERFLRSTRLPNSARLLPPCTHSRSLSSGRWRRGARGTPGEWAPSPPCPCTAALQLLLAPAPGPARSLPARGAVRLRSLGGGPGACAWAGVGPGHTPASGSPATPLPRQTSFGAPFPLDGAACAARRPRPAGLQAQDAGCTRRALTPLPPGH